jgi:hypothetical protein
MDPKKPLYFLTHEGRPYVFSGFGIPLEDSHKSPLVGMLLIDRPERCPDTYLQKLTETFAEVITAPMTAKGERGLYIRMRIDEPFSLDLLTDSIDGPKAETLARSLEIPLGLGYLPNTRLRLRWSKADGLWVSQFDI